MKNAYRKIGIVIFSWPEAGNVLLTDLIDTLGSLAARLYIVVWGKGSPLFESNNKAVEVFEVYHAGQTNLFTKSINYAYTQLKISFKLLKLSSLVDLWLFVMGGEGLIIPMLAAKMRGKLVLICPVGSGLDSLKAQQDPLAGVFGLLRNMNYRLADGIILNSKRLIEEFGLQKYRSKIFVAYGHFIHFDKLKVQKPLHKRDNLVGYVGRLSQEKGILNFLEAIPLVIETRDDVRFLIAGDGQLRDRAETYIQQANLSSKVKFLGWVPHDELPSYLNELKLLVSPSYTEAGPYSVFEAMACGTPVLSTPVGQVPDAVTDGKTGFILENNSPECIAKNIIRALKHPNLEEITGHAHEFVEREVSHEAAVNLFKKVLQSLAR
jgi:glycosyltransferase involved in cell wall biosynthesis